MTNRPYRTFDHARDIDAVLRIWVEVGWIDGDDDKVLKATSDFLKTGNTEVATIDDRAECAVHWTNGTVQYQSETLQLGAVTGVTTSHLARKLGFARELTARALANQVAAGMEVSALGMFDQGFYNKVGFGTGPYINRVQFDPSTLAVEHPFRPPKRLTASDYKDVHQAMTNRRKFHGSVVLQPPEGVKAEMLWTERSFGLGYHDGPNGELTHFIWGEMNGEHGPYRIETRAYQTTEQLMELLALMKSLGDQVSSFTINEFGEFQFQDLLRLPFRTERASRGGKHHQKLDAFAPWQIRILQLEKCLEHTYLPHANLSFNLALHDPVSEVLASHDGWRGVTGDYVIHLGEHSSAKPGSQKGLPTLTASINAFTRMWFGVRPATHLALTDDLQASDELLAELDAAFRLPVPDFSWDF